MFHTGISIENFVFNLIAECRSYKAYLLLKIGYSRHALLLFLFFMAFSLNAATSTGSWTAPSRESFVTYSGTGNAINGFAGMYNGFALTDTGSAVSFNSRFPVGSNISLNGGSLALETDLLLDSKSLIQNWGIITGNNNLVEFEPHNQPVGLPNVGLNQIALGGTGGYPQLSSYWNLAWTSDSQYLAVGTSYAKFLLYSFSEPTLTFLTFVGVSGQIYSVDFCPLAGQPYYLVTATQYGLFVFQVTPPSSIINTYGLTGSYFSGVSWHPSGTLLAANINASPQTIEIFDFNSVTGSLIPVTTRALPSGLSINASTSNIRFDYSGNYIVGAYKGSSGQLQVLHWDGALLTVTASANVGNNLYCCDWSPNGSFIVAGTGTTINQVLIYGFNRNTSTLTPLPSYTQTVPAYVRGIGWSPDGSYIAVGLGATSNNVLLYAVNTDLQQLFLVGSYSTNDTFIENSIRWVPNGLYFAAGESWNWVRIFNFQPLNLQSSNLVFNSSAQLRTPIICSGSCIIDGNGNSLDCNSQIITVTTGGSLLFKNLTLENIYGTNLNCIDNTGTISFENVKCLVNNSMQINQGSLAIIGDLSIIGTGTFVYSTNQTSTIFHGATWYFDRGMTFSYYPSSASNNLINFADSTAQLYLYETSLYAQSTGLQLTKGTFTIDGTCPFDNSATAAANGILIGDNALSANNMNIMIMPESGINAGSGYVVYQNIE